MESYLITLLTRAQPSWLWRYGLTAFMILVTTLIWMSLREAAPSLLVLLYLPAIFLAALLFDKRSGLLATGLSVAAEAMLFAEPLFRLAVESADDLLVLIIFGLLGTAMTLVMDVLRNALRSLQQAKERLAASDQEKDLLLSEVHHRIRNDIQFIIAHLQLAKAQGGDLHEALDRATERIGILGKVYGRLRQQDGSRLVDAKLFLDQLVEDLRLMQAVRPVGLHARVEPADIDPGAALSLGIITNELITNALKYAFPDGRAGRIDVAFRRDGDDFVLTVQDNGVGLAGGAGSTAPQGSGLGGQIVRQLTEQFQGSLKIGEGNGGGLRTTVRLPVGELAPQDV